MTNAQNPTTETISEKLWLTSSQSEALSCDVKKSSNIVTVINRISLLQDRQLSLLDKNVLQQALGSRCWSI